MKNLNNRIIKLFLVTTFLIGYSSALIAEVRLEDKFYKYDLKGEDRLVLPLKGELEKFKYQFFAVFDGHMGEEAVKFFSDKLSDKIPNQIDNFFANKEEIPKEIENILVNQIDKAEEKFTDASGTTATIAMVTYTEDAFNNLYIASIGDSKAILSDNGRAVELTTDHVPDNFEEVKRFKDIGIPIDETKLSCKPKDTWIGSAGVYPLTRSLGAKQMKSAFVDKEGKSLIWAKPDIKMVKLSPKNKFLILGSDGLWDWVKPQKAVDIVNENLNNLDAASDVLVKAVNDATEEANEDRKFCDDTSFIIVKFVHPEKPDEKPKVETVAPPLPPKPAKAPVAPPLPPRVSPKPRVVEEEIKPGLSAETLGKLKKAAKIARKELETGKELLKQFQKEMSDRDLDILIKTVRCDAIGKLGRSLRVLEDNVKAAICKHCKSEFERNHPMAKDAVCPKPA